MRIITVVLAASLTVALAPAPAAQSESPVKHWPSSTPQAEGLKADVLAALDAEIAAGKHGYVDSMLVVRHGKIVFDRTYAHDYDRIYGEEARKPGPLNPHDPTGPYNYFNPWWHPFYRRGDLHSMQSVTKSVTSVVIGVAVTRGEFPPLKTPVLKFFEGSTIDNLDDRKRRMTIRDLLTMTAGLDWHENLPYADPRNTTMAMEAGFDWVAFTINRPMANDPGTVFNYNSGATQLLSYIFRKATGRDIEEYARQHLFTPLGIDAWFWKRTPSGLADTEGGLYLRPHDIAKIAYLYLEDGMWNGKPLVDAGWVKASLTPHIGVSDGVKYGYKWWIYSYGAEGNGTAWGGSGFGGQRPIVIPEHDLVVVFTGWNILPGRPSLGVRTAIDRVIEAVERPTR